MPGDSTRAAYEAFITRFRLTIACVGDAHVAGDGYEPDRLHTIVMRPFHPGLGDRLPLHAGESGRPDLLLDIIHHYTIAYAPTVGRVGSYWVRYALYRYQVYDLEGRELLLYHWHPGGLSSITTPHLHAACAPRISLPRSRTNVTRQIDAGKLHLPTNHVQLEDVIELLIRDLGVEPRPGFRTPGDTFYWETVLRDNRTTAKSQSPE